MPRPKVQRNETKYKYSKHDIVWAKTAGYRWWPASITCLPSRNKCFYKVDFIGDRSYALLSEQKLAPYVSFRDQYQVNKKNDKHFTNAVTIASRKYEQLLLKQEASIKSKGSVECKTSQLKQQLNKQIELPQIPENIQQISSLNQYQILSPAHQTPSPSNFNNFQSQPLEQIQSLDKHTERTPTQLVKASQSIDQEPLSLQPQNREKLIEQILTKYKLNRIPDLKQHRKTQKQNSSSQKKKNNKRKFILKHRNSPIEENQHIFGEDELLVRKIYRFLMKKLHSFEQSQEISLSLKDQIVREKVQRVQCLKKVMQWISMTESQNIISYHSQWINFYKESERERQKHSNLTMQQQSDPLSIK